MALTNPTQDLTSRLLGRVEHKERLMGFEMAPMAGNTPVALHSLAEVLAFLRLGNLDAWDPGFRVRVNYVDPEGLRRWLAEVLEDGELARAIDDVMVATESYAERVRWIKELIERRLRQSAPVAGRDEDGPPASTDKRR